MIPNAKAHISGQSLNHHHIAYKNKNRTCGLEQIKYILSIEEWLRLQLPPCQKGTSNVASQSPPRGRDLCG
jgi:hypothetical protein